LLIPSPTEVNIIHVLSICAVICVNQIEIKMHHPQVA